MDSLGARRVPAGAGPVACPLRLPFVPQEPRMCGNAPGVRGRIPLHLTVAGVAGP
ncbi:hypothetical protein [Nocardia otitidiscaviarum]|uniref:hypothetical protein n=1 Tax=Nocardia otitidiscaviarum TaxID=1823 RepID=UPI00031D3198|nr:hypothetical protein [Nocardia otitidiscaviarum]